MVRALDAHFESEDIGGSLCDLSNLGRRGNGHDDMLRH